MISKLSVREILKKTHIHFKNLSVDEVQQVERLGPGFEDKCVECDFRGVMDYQVTYHSGEWGLLCGTCGVALIQQKFGAVE